MATVSLPTGIVRVYGVTCTNVECSFHESLHTSDPAEATRTAKELGWRLQGAESICPLCVAATESNRKPAPGREGGAILTTRKHAEKIHRPAKKNEPDKNAPHELEEMFWKKYYPLRLQGRSAAGTHQHLVVLRHFERFLGRDSTTHDLNEDTVTRFLNWLSQGRSPVTTNKCIDKLCAQWRFLNQRGYVPTWPEIRKLTEPERIPKAWMPDEMKKIVDACRRHPGYTEGIKASDWWTALLAVLYDTGERIGAVMQVRWQDIDLKSRWVILRAETRKHGLRDRTFRLHESTVMTLGKIIEPARERVFPWGRSSEQLWPEYKLILVRAKLPHDRKSMFHAIRRTVATWVMAAGGNPTEVLDHSDPKVTRSYIDPRQIERRYPCDILPRPDKALDLKQVKRVEPLAHPVNGTALPETLGDYFAGTFLPTLDGTASAKRNYEAALRRFGDFIGHDPLIAGITPELMGSFKTWLASQSITGKVQVKYANRVQAVVHHKFADRFPIKRRGPAGGAA